jgi:hypothetical protein
MPIMVGVIVSTSQTALFSSQGVSLGKQRRNGFGRSESMYCWKNKHNHHGNNHDFDTAPEAFRDGAIAPPRKMTRKFSAFFIFG